MVSVRTKSFEKDFEKETRPAMGKSSETMTNLTIPTQEGQGSSLTLEEVPISLNFLETDDDSESISSPEKLVIDENQFLEDDSKSSSRQLDFSENEQYVTPSNSIPSSPKAERVTEKQNCFPHKEEINHFWLSLNKEKQVDPQKVLKRLSQLNRKINRMNKRISKIQLEKPKDVPTYKKVEPNKKDLDELINFRSKLLNFLETEDIQKFSKSIMISVMVHFARHFEELKQSNKLLAEKFEVFNIKTKNDQ